MTKFQVNYAPADRMSFHMLSKPLSAAVASALLFVMGGCGEKEGDDRAQEPVTVIAEKVPMVAEQVSIEAIGSARAATSAEIYPEAEGRVLDVAFGIGDYVRKGAPLIRLDDRQERLAVRLAEIAVKEAEQLLGRYRRIEDTGAISASQIEAGETALSSARIELEQARVALADRTVRAPFSGHVGLTTIDEGDRVSPTTPITQIDDRATLYVDFAVPEEVFSALGQEQTVEMIPYSDPDRTVTARILAVDSTVSAEERTFTVRAAVDNENDRLRPGMSFRVAFQKKGRALPAVPEAAIVWGAEGSYLWAVRDGAATRVPLTIVERRDGNALVDAKLGRDDMIIIQGVQKVREGQAVELVAPTPRRPADVETGRAVAGDRESQAGPEAAPAGG